MICAESTGSCTQSLSFSDWICMRIDFDIVAKRITSLGESGPAGQGVCERTICSISGWTSRRAQRTNHLIRPEQTPDYCELHDQLQIRRDDIV